MDNIEKKQSLISRARHFFALESDGSSMYKCLLCNQIKSGKQLTNLVTHLKSMHKDEYSNNVCNPEKSYAVKRLQLLQNCVEKVTINKEPFQNILKSAFQKLIQRKLNKLNFAGHNLNLSDPNLPSVKNHIKETATKIRERIKCEVKNEMVSVMVDIASKNSRSVLGISIQYILNDTHVIRTIGLVELKESHTADYIADLIYECLQSYQIDLIQVISLTTDNAANMGATIKRLNELCEESAEKQTETFENDDPDNFDILFISDEVYEQELHNVLHETDETDQILLDTLLNENDEDAELLPSVVDGFKRKHPPSLIYVNRVSCAAHTLQLAVKDALNMLESNGKDFLDLCRAVGKYLRLANTKCAIINNGLKYKYIRPDVQHI